jgi:hypothetical protein
LPNGCAPCRRTSLVSPPQFHGNRATPPWAVDCDLPGLMFWARRRRSQRRGACFSGHLLGCHLFLLRKRAARTSRAGWQQVGVPRRQSSAGPSPFCGNQGPRTFRARCKVRAETRVRLCSVRLSTVGLHQSSRPTEVTGSQGSDGRSSLQGRTPEGVALWQRSTGPPRMPRTSDLNWSPGAVSKEEGSAARPARGLRLSNATLLEVDQAGPRAPA